MDVPRRWGATAEMWKSSGTWLSGGTCSFQPVVTAVRRWQGFWVIEEARDGQPSPPPEFLSFSALPPSCLSLDLPREFSPQGLCTYYSLWIALLPGIYLQASLLHFIWACVLSKPFLDDSIQKSISGTFLAVQWLRIHLSMQGTWVRSLVQEDPMCRKATVPARHNCWAHVPQLWKLSYSSACALQPEEPAQWEARAPQLESSPCSLQLEKAREERWRLTTAKK